MDLAVGSSVGEVAASVSRETRGTPSCSHLPISPCTSPYLPAQVSRETRGGRHTLVLVDRVFEHGYLAGEHVPPGSPLDLPGTSPLSLLQVSYTSYPTRDLRTSPLYLTPYLPHPAGILRRLFSAARGSRFKSDDPTLNLALLSLQVRGRGRGRVQGRVKGRGMTTSRYCCGSSSASAPRSPLDLPCISLASPHISPVSPPHLQLDFGLADEYAPLLNLPSLPSIAALEGGGSAGRRLDKRQLQVRCYP